MRRLSLSLRGLAAAVAVASTTLVAAGSAQAIVIDMNPATTGTTGAVAAVQFPTDQSHYYGVAMVPGDDGALLNNGIPVVQSTAACSDPWLSSDLLLPANGLCWHAGGTVLHGNETFALTWDPDRMYYATTRNYVEQFLQNVAAGSGTLTSPYADTSQYSDGQADAKDASNANGHAENASVYGGGCVDFGNPGGYTCQFGDTSGSGTGNNYPDPGANVSAPSGGCAAHTSGVNQWGEQPGGAFGAFGPTGQPTPNSVCLTDADIQQEITSIAGSAQFQSHVVNGYTPLVVVMTPPGVEVCLNSSATLCSANGLPVTKNSAGAYAAGNGPAFCSYHGQVNGVPYVVLPWVASWLISLGCDEPDATPIPNPVDPSVLAQDAGQRLVSPLSQAQIAAVVNPDLNGWFADNGQEINDNDGCRPFGNGLDAVTVGSASYLLQREFNNAGVIESDPNALACTPDVNLHATFVAPSSVDVADTVELDGSTSVSSLIVPKANYAWSFGDGSANATGPSVTHSFTTAGTYTVTLTITDRGGNTSTATQTITVLSKGSGTSPAPPPPTPQSVGLQAHLQLLPSSLRTVLRTGVSVLVSSNQPADGIASISISRRSARRAHIASHGRAPSIVVGRGTISGLINGTVELHLHVDRRMARKLTHLKHVDLTVRLVVLAAGRHSIAIDAAGQY
jgi:hypothetical protein